MTVSSAVQPVPRDLAQFGFERVYHFVGGKTEWIERGLPPRGTGPFLLLAGQVLRAAAATCRPDARAGTVRRELSPDPNSIYAVTKRTSWSAAYGGTTSLAT